MIEIKFYKTLSGKSPIEDFLENLQPKEAAKITWVLRLIADLDRVPIEYFKKLESTEEIWEVRAKLGSNAFRLLGFWDGNRFVVLTNGFKKKTKKTPKTEIKLAESPRIEYLTRKQNE